MNTKTGPFRTFQAGEVLAANRRVKRSATANQVVYADAGEPCVGVTVELAVAIGENVNVQLWNQGGSHLITALVAIGDNVAVYGAVDGKIDVAVVGDPIAKSLEASSADLDDIEVATYSA